MSVVSLIAACDRRGLIGRGGDLPWRLPADLAHFKAVTLGKPVVMGRRTWESLRRPLPGRDNIVVTRRRGYRAPGAAVAASPAAALALASGATEIVVIGGAQLYAALAPRATRLYLTRVEGEFAGDTWFPFAALGATGSDPAGDPWAWLDAHPAWRRVAHEFRPADARNPHPCHFLRYERRGPA